MEKTTKPFKKLLRNLKLVGLDSSCFIYKFEEHPQFEPPASVIFDLLSKEKLEAVTSIITAAEILTKPYEEENFDVVDLYETVFLELPSFSLLDLSYTDAKEAAKLKSRYNITLPDAFQIVSSLSAGAKAFITNDEKLRKIEEIEVLLLKDYTS